MTDAGTTYLTLRPPHRTFLFWAVLVMVLSSVAVGVIGLREDGWTAGTAVRAVFILAMVLFWVGAMRSGTTADREGMTLHRGPVTRRVAWAQVEQLGTDHPGQDARRVTALVEGKPVVLPGVLVAELDQLELHRVG
ncbi:hypothetical protein [Ornithinimicrobium pratense]|uniref:PH domain-containing protein n=1 Tax=Ornithinimicrobium pratense TaxID=2593973 RepID=A0A5J6V6E4_9MICO|nr:hypothetical protein [Ornithinimicrobium pratense]QFG69459.1 hypothetical protein FY030_12760 [Ornithinimicrobium pratense]